MDFNELAGIRYSARKYKQQPVSRGDLDKILEAGRLAPTAHNFQPQRIIAVQQAEDLARLNNCTECRYGAPLALIVCYDKNTAWVREYDGKCSGDVDASIVTTHMMLAAKAIGIDSTWIMYFMPEALRTEFALPDNLEPVALLYLGYADDTPSPRHAERLDIAETVSGL